jgi:hypothetical protein
MKDLEAADTPQVLGVAIADMKNVYDVDQRSAKARAARPATAAELCAIVQGKDVPKGNYRAEREAYEANLTSEKAEAYLENLKTRWERRKLAQQEVLIPNPIVDLIKSKPNAPPFKKPISDKNSNTATTLQKEEKNPTLAASFPPKKNTLMTLSKETRDNDALTTLEEKNEIPAASLPPKRDTLITSLKETRDGDVSTVSEEKNEPPRVSHLPLNQTEVNKPKSNQFKTSQPKLHPKPTTSAISLANHTFSVEPRSQPASSGIFNQANESPEGALVSAAKIQQPRDSGSPAPKRTLITISDSERARLDQQEDKRRKQDLEIEQKKKSVRLEEARKRRQEQDDARTRERRRKIIIEEAKRDGVEISEAEIVEKVEAHMDKLVVSPWSWSEITNA